MQKLINALLLIALLATISLLTGCATKTEYVNKLIMPQANATIMQECKPITMLSNKDKTLQDLISVTIENAQKYHECEVLNKAKIDWYNYNFNNINKKNN